MATATVPNNFQAGKEDSTRSAHTTKETERKFLVTALPKNLSKFPNYEILQAYISIMEGTERRIRQKTTGGFKKYFWTEKSTEPGIERDEKEVEISESQFNFYLKRALFPPTKKTRYEIPHRKHKIELDIFHGPLEGLVMAEVEFKNGATARRFHPPSWMNIDATNDERYRNRNLAQHGIPKDQRLEVMLRRNDPERFNLSAGIEEAIDQIKTKFLEGKRVVLVGVAGGSASGKSSTVAGKIKEAFGNNAILISMDDYFKDASQISRMPRINGFTNYDTPDAVQLSLLWEHLYRLRKGDRIQKSLYDFKTGTSKPRAERLEPKRVIIVEGLHALTGTRPSMFDVKVFVEASKFSEIIRRLPRDTIRTDLQPSETLSYFCTVAYPMQELHVDRTRTRADIIIVNEYNPETEAQKIGIVDNQVKFRKEVDENALLRLHAIRRSTVIQKDEYYETHGSISGKFANMLRIRIENSTLIFSYKGPSPSPAPRKQARFEFPFMGSIDGLRTAMESISNGKTSTISKQRSIYSYKGVTINVDRDVTATTASYTKELGSFVELSYSDNDAELGTVEEITKALGLTKPIHKQYVDMA